MKGSIPRTACVCYLYEDAAVSPGREERLKRCGCSQKFLSCFDVTEVCGLCLECHHATVRVSVISATCSGLKVG